MKGERVGNAANYYYEAYNKVKVNPDSKEFYYRQKV